MGRDAQVIFAVKKDVDHYVMNENRPGIETAGVLKTGSKGHTINSCIPKNISGRGANLTRYRKNIVHGDVVAAPRGEDREETVEDAASSEASDGSFAANSDNGNA